LPRAPSAIETERLRLEPRDAAHAAALFARLRDAELYRFVPALPPSSVASLEERFRRTAAGPGRDDECWWNWTVVVRDGPLAGAAIGTVETTILEREDRALIAYSFGRDAWGRGYATEACAAAIARLRDATSVAFVAAFVDTRNARSIALVERLGLERKRTIENADRFKGLPSDEFHYWLALVR
jgi:ribosomal-protein-alanine N-acetyltransferase